MGFRGVSNSRSTGLAYACCSLSRRFSREGALQITDGDLPIQRVGERQSAM